jgi:SAM-dependent methyltransferase
MYKKLQHNFDVIQYLIKDVSPEQLLWRESETSLSLGEILDHLRDVERWHAAVQSPDVEAKSGLLLTASEKKGLVSEKRNLLTDYGRTFEQYACYRKQTIECLKRVGRDQGQQRIAHPVFGQVTLAELVARIDAYDQSYIRQIEKIIHGMPFNPLLARAIYEIDHYYQRYRPHLNQVSSVLDIGVGTGLALRYLMLQNPHITFAGVDVRDLRLPGVKVPLKLYDGYTLPFDDAQFDVSLLFYVLHHCHNPGRVLAEASRITRQRLIIIEEFDRPDADETSLDLTERQSHRALGLPADLPYQLFDKPEFEAMLKECRLVELEQQLLPSRTTRPVQKYLYVLEKFEARRQG